MDDRRDCVGTVIPAVHSHGCIPAIRGTLIRLINACLLAAEAWGAAAAQAAAAAKAAAAE